VIGNAVKYSPGGTPVQVRVSRQEDWAVITVRDGGVGIPADELPHIFSRYYRASTSIGIKGTGIGLAGAKAIVTQHGGHIALDSIVGEGTTVVISLPCFPHQGSDEESDEEEVPSEACGTLHAPQHVGDRRQATVGTHRAGLSKANPIPSGPTRGSFQGSCMRTCDCGPSTIASDCAGTPLAGRANDGLRLRSAGASWHRGTRGVPWEPLCPGGPRRG
jgi:hypothetical protein